jgi:membrane protein implicated in regulation of membrane protease activity
LHFLFAAISVPAFVGTLVGVLAVLILLMVIIVLLCVYIKRVKLKQDSAEGDTEYDDVIGRATTIRKANNPIEMKANEAYGTHQQDNNIVEAQYEELP